MWLRFLSPSHCSCACIYIVLLIVSAAREATDVARLAKCVQYMFTLIVVQLRVLVWSGVGTQSGVCLHC